MLDEQNIEIDRTALKADLVYNIQYRGNPRILNMELQADSDNETAIRMLKYRIGLYDKHRRPVISTERARSSLALAMGRNGASDSAHNHVFTLTMHLMFV